MSNSLYQPLTNWQATVSNIGWRSAYLSLSISRKLTDARRILKIWWVTSWNIRQKSMKNKKIKFHHLNTCSLEVIPDFVIFLFSDEICSFICWRSRSLKVHHDLVSGYVPSIITARPVNWSDGPCGLWNLHVRSFSSLFTTSINASHQNPSKQQVM